jgi:hypothetical protein
MISDALEKYHAKPEIVAEIKPSAATVYAGAHSSVKTILFPHHDF